MDVYSAEPTAMPTHDLGEHGSALINQLLAAREYPLTTLGRISWLIMRDPRASPQGPDTYFRK
jgi:hypothetical protein